MVFVVYLLNSSTQDDLMVEESHPIPHVLIVI
jgi:hypothetical protein